MKDKYKKNFYDWMVVNRPNINVIGDYAGKDTSIKFFFKNCEHSPIMTPASIKRGSECSICYGKQIDQTTCLSFKRPDLAAEWHPILNNNLTPNDISPGSSKKVWWLCSRCGSSYDATCAHRTTMSSGCPYCAGQKVNHTNNLVVRFPELIEEWSIKNYPLTPYDVLPMSDKKVWWKYKCGHENQQILCNRTLHGKGCSICGGSFPKTTEQHKNDILQKHGTNISVIGNYSNNRTKIEYKCNTCDGKWFAVPYAVLQGCGCPLCNVSRGEREIAMWLKQNLIQFEQHKKFEDCKLERPLAFDFYLSQINTCIEFDGIQHFEQVENWEALDIIKKRDNIKTVWCKDNKILLIRISYKEFDEISNILNKILYDKA